MESDGGSSSHVLMSSLTLSLNIGCLLSPVSDLVPSESLFFPALNVECDAG